MLDDKRFVLNDGIHTLAYFHKDCKKRKRCTKRFSQMIINKKRFSQIRRVQKDSCKKKKNLANYHKRLTRLKISACK